MKAICQRVNYAQLFVNGKLISKIEKGFCVYLGIDIQDTKLDAEKLARKIGGLRIFEDQNQKMNLALSQVGGNILLVSNFTLCADCKHGFRPSFTNAQRGEQAKSLYDYFKLLLNQQGIDCQTGIFGADMRVLTENDGPINIILDSKEI